MTEPASAPADRRIVVPALGISQTLAWASSYYLPAILADPIARDLALSSNWLFGLFTAALVISGMIGPEVGGQIDAFGGRGVLSLSNLVIATGLLMLGFAHGLAMLGGRLRGARGRYGPRSLRCGVRDARAHLRRASARAITGGQWGANSSTSGVYAACVKLRDAVAQKLGFNSADAEFADGRSAPATAACRSPRPRATGACRRGRDRVRRPRQEVSAVDVRRALRRSRRRRCDRRDAACGACSRCARRAASSIRRRRAARSSAP